MICDNCIHNAVCDRLHGENHCGYKHTEADVINPELEKIKEDILNLDCTGWKDHPILDREEVLTILDKYISKLNGDCKQSRCDNCLNNTDELSGECYECVKGIEDWYEPLKENKE